MVNRHVAESASLDHLDRQLLRALQISPRAPFSRIATALDVSEQTIARRYRALRADGIVRVVALVAPEALGESNWMVRVQCRPDGTIRLAEALARRDDVGWVAVGAGGSEVICALRSRTREERDELLVQRLPRTAPVLSVAASVVLHRFVGGRGDDWAGLEAELSADQAAAITEGPVDEPARRTDARLEPADERILDLLAHDGRTGYAALAKASGLSEGRVARRLAALLDAGIVYFDVDLAAVPLGFTAQANLWLTVVPAHLDAAGRALSEFPEVAFAAAITGSANLTASVTCRDLDALYTFLITRVGAIEGVQSMEVSPVLRRVKQAGALTRGDRLADLAAR